MTAIEAVPHPTVTRQLLELSRRRTGAVAIAGLPGLEEVSYPRLADFTMSVAAALVRRGLRDRDTVATYLADAASHVAATHAIRAAGAVPSPVPACRTVLEIAGQLADCGARMLITSPELSATALAAADRSWVRQVITFGEAAGTVNLYGLVLAGAGPDAGERHPGLPAGPYPAEMADVQPDDVALLPYAREPGGTLAARPVTHLALARQLGEMADAIRIGPRDVVVAAPPAGDGLRYTMILDHILLAGAAIVARSAAELAAGDFGGYRATAAVVPSGADVGGQGDMLRMYPIAG
jgi:acyl-CoA synthetase (AMP-forming)/AMP-acid ligase II